MNPTHSEAERVADTRDAMNPSTRAADDLDIADNKAISDGGFALHGVHPKKTSKSLAIGGPFHHQMFAA
jgi:hypothetical protein